MGGFYLPIVRLETLNYIAKNGNVQTIAETMFDGNTEAATIFKEKYSNDEFVDSLELNENELVNEDFIAESLNPVDSNNNQGYNNGIRAKQDIGGAINAQINQGRSEEIGDRRNQSLSEATRGSKDSWPEDKAEFVSRSKSYQSAGKQKVVVENDSSAFAYFPADPNNSVSYKAVRYLQGLGIKVVYCDGGMESNKDGKTSTHPEAVTAPDGTVYINKHSALSAIAIAVHEGTHHFFKQNSSEYAEYRVVIEGNIDVSSENFIEIVVLINKENFNSEYTIDDENFYPAFIEELTAYVNEYITSDYALAEEKFAPMFSDWDAVVEASRKFNEAIGLDFSDLQSTANEAATDSLAHPAPTAGKVLKMSPVSAKAKNYVKDIAKRLGTNLQFVDMAAELARRGNNTEGLIIYPEGFFDPKNNTLYVGNEVANPVEFVFKHELTHFGEQSPLYVAFAKAVRNSKAFKKWLAAQDGLKNVDPKLRESALHEIYKSRYKGLQELTEPKAQRETIANFVADVLFKGDINTLSELLNESTPTSKNAIVRLISDFFSWLKSKFTDSKQIISEITDLENMYRELIGDAVEVTKDGPTSDGDVVFETGTTEQTDAEAAQTEPNEKTVDDNGEISYSYYNEFASNAMAWANSATTKPGDTKILNNNGGEFVLLEATENGYIEVARGKYKEVLSYYDEMQRQADNSFYGYSEEIRSNKNGNLQSEFVGTEIGRNDAENSRQTGSQGLQADTARNNENLHTGNKGESDLSFSVPSADSLLDRYEKGEITREEYLERINKDWQDKADEYGTMPDGEMVTENNKPAAVPQKVSPTRKTRGFIRNVLEANYNEDVENGLKAEVLAGNKKLTHESISNKSLVTSARKRIVWWIQSKKRADFGSFLFYKY